MRRIILFVTIIGLVSCASNQSKNTNSPLGYKGSSKGVFGYNSVPEALNALKNQEGTTLTVRDNWTIADVNTENEKAIWSFPPVSHPAYPSAVKRTLVQRNGGIYMETKVSCGASKIICDSLVKDFIQLSERVRDEFQNQKNP